VLHETPMQRDRARTICDKSKAGRRAFTRPELDVDAQPLDELIPARHAPLEPPEAARARRAGDQPALQALSTRNFDLDEGFYPLGSCTMKHNPKLTSASRRFRQRPPAPAQDPSGAGRARTHVRAAGRPRGDRGPASRLAAAVGRLARRARGVLLTRAYHEDRGEHRTKVLTPDTAHGTNPATVTMAGYEVVKVGTNADGGVDVEDLRAKADDQVACLMLTNPNTLGLFDRNIEEIASIVHGVGATLYYDGANLNAVMGISRPGDMGFDIVHYNLHKTFTQPHGGGGPGAGPIAVSDRIEPYLPRPQVVKRGEDFVLDYDRPKSIGRLRGFQGNYGVFVRSYAYILSLGGTACARRRRPRCSTRTTCWPG
jgi:glycine dehydrogenase subunit 2